MRIHTSTLALAFAIGAAPLAAHAQDASGSSPAPAQDPAAAAQQHYRRGIELYEQQAFEQGLGEFRTAQSLYPSPNIRLYVARCLRGLGRADEASIEFGLTAREARDRAIQDPRYAPTRDAADEEGRALVPQIGRVRVVAPGVPEWAWIRIGGHEVRAGDIGLATPVRPGTVTVEVEAHGYRRAERSVTVAAGGSQEVSINLDRDPSWDGQPPTAQELADEAARRGASTGNNPPSSSAPIVLPSLSSPPAWMRPVGYGAMGVGAAALITSAILGGVSLSIYNDVYARCGGVSCPSAEQENIDSGRGLQVASNVLVVTGALVAVGGGVLWFLGRRPGRPIFGFTGNGIVMNGRF